MSSNPIIIHLNKYLTFLSLLVFKSRKRRRNVSLHKKNIAKENVERGRYHVTKRGREVAEKVFKPQTVCNCKQQCSAKINEVQQNLIFMNYYKICEWSQKTMFIRAHVTMTNVKTKKSQLYPIFAAKNRNINCEYSLDDGDGISQRVCRNFFINCVLQVSSARIHSAMKTKRKNPSATERRGTQPSANKTKEDQELAVKQFIESIPAYESHYGRSSSEKKYLQSNLNIISLYREYVTVMDSNQRPTVSENIFRTIFNTQFN